MTTKEALTAVVWVKYACGLIVVIGLVSLGAWLGRLAS
jgi:hypothetical protein